MQYALLGILAGVLGFTAFASARFMYMVVDLLATEEPADVALISDGVDYSAA